LLYGRDLGLKLKTFSDNLGLSPQELEKCYRVKEDRSQIFKYRRILRDFCGDLSVFQRNIVVIEVRVQSSEFL